MSPSHKHQVSNLHEDKERWLQLVSANPKQGLADYVGFFGGVIIWVMWSTGPQNALFWGGKLLVKLLDVEGYLAAADLDKEKLPKKHAKKKRPGSARHSMAAPPRQAAHRVHRRVTRGCR